ncbi:MAG: EH signature domain-containing protein [Candidatus Poribacteria bacterium]|nr:EH signature domain-containing protein [Candidatus Poribacteria bacterium]
MNSAKKILEFDFNAEVFARCAPQPSKPSQQNLNTLKEIVEKHGNADYEQPNREDLRQIYHLFIQASRDGKLHQEFNTSKRIRQLTWALTFSKEKQPRIVNTPQLHDALQLIGDDFRISNLPGIFNALLQTWDAPNARMLRAFIKKHLTDYNGKRKFAQELKTNMAWYCEENSATQLAMELLRSNRKLSDVWSFLELPDYMNTYPYFSAVAEAFVSLIRNSNSVQTSVETHTPTGFVSLIRHLDREVLTDVINFLEKHKNDETSRSILSKLIETLGLDASEHARAPVQSYVLRKWQDPRIAGADVKWHGVSTEARKIFTKWLTEADLEFFFDIVAKACNDQKFAYRKAFWMAYLEHISFCRPVLRENVEKLIQHNPEALQFYRERQPATLTSGTSNQHAFIIQMGEYTFVEFSTNAACYVYHSSKMPFHLDSSDYTMNTSHSRRVNTLRNIALVDHRVNHVGSEKYSWQGRFESWIYNELGVVPERSYRS